MFDEQEDKAGQFVNEDDVFNFLSLQDPLQQPGAGGQLREAEAPASEDQRRHAAEAHFRGDQVLHPQQNQPRTPLTHLI